MDTGREIRKVRIPEAKEEMLEAKKEIRAAKKEIREKILAARDSLTPADILEKSGEIFKKLCSLKQYENAKTVIAYLDYRNEVVTRGFISKCIENGKKIAVPKVIPGTERELKFYKVFDLSRDVQPGYKGIPEPKAGVLEEVEPSSVDLAVIPGVAFDLRRYRIGYGAGYYDRYLLKLRRDCFKIGVAFNLQILNTIPYDGYDIPMDMIITETMII